MAQRYTLRDFYPGSDVRGLGGFGVVASQSSSPAELSARLNAIVDELGTMWSWAKAKIIAKDVLASYFSMGFSTDTKGLASIDLLISLKRKSIADVLAGATALAKWLNGVEVARAQIEQYIAYVNNNASAMANIRQLAAELRQTAADYASSAANIAKKAGYVLGGASIITLLLAGVVLWRFGPPLLAAWLGPPRALSGYRRRRRLRA